MKAAEYIGGARRKMEIRNRAARVTDLAPGDRPREKLERAGADALGDNELVALVLGHGPAGANALETANRLLAVTGGIAGLTRVRRQQLRRVPGVGDVLASRLQAAVELGRRTLAVSPADRPRFASPKEIAYFLLPRFGAYPVERFGVMLLDTKLRLLGVELVSVGGIDFSTAHPRDVFRGPVMTGAAAIIVFHNHPSGDPTPSVDDVRLTRRLVDAGQVLGVDVLDHLVLADGRYYSMKENKVLP